MQADLESYIPVHPNEFQIALERSSICDFEAWESVRSQKGRIAQIVHQRVHRQFQELIEAYTFLDPDRDPSVVPDVGSPCAIELFESAEKLLLQARFFRLTPSQIYQALRSASVWGVKLKIRFRDYQRLRVYARGDTVSTRTTRTWYRLFRKQDLEVPIYKQLVVIFERREPDGLHLRMFKNIPHMDVDMLLPGSVRISWLDQGKIGIPTLWGFSVTVTRMIRSVWLVALLGLLEVFQTIWVYLAVSITTILYGVKLFFSYKHARNRQLLNVAQSLYFQTLSNNKGVLLRLEDEAEQQWITQALVLLYILRLRQRSGESMHPIDDLDALDKECEKLLETLGLGKIDFDIQAAFRLLVDARLFVPIEGQAGDGSGERWEFANG